MAGQHGYQTKLVRLVALLFLLCLLAGLVRRVTSSLRSSNLPTNLEPAQPNLNPDPPTTPRLNRIHGRWAAVRASLGLPPLPHEVVFIPRPNKRASRFDLDRKRRANEARPLPPLHFAPNARPSHPDEKETATVAL